jgi:hypothetical protein
MNSLSLEIRNPKPEIRNKSECPNDEVSKMGPDTGSAFRSFGIRHSDLFRISGFGFRILSCLALLIVGGCGEFTRYDFPHTPTEITDHPEILYNKTVELKDMAYMGVKLSDPGFAVRKERVLRESEGGWVVCRDGARYRLEDKTVATLGVWDNRTIERLYLETPGAIEQKFGKPERIEDTPELVIHYYNGGKISVLWNKQEKQVNAVNVSR